MTLSPTESSGTLVEAAPFLQGKEIDDTLLRAAALRPEWATPYVELSQRKLDAPDPTRLTLTEAYVEAAYRMPYNYGYILSANAFIRDPRLSLADQRLALFNQLIAVENTAFYPDYYSWVADSFARLDLPVQACAMYRQALWAVDRLPRDEAYRAKVRKDLEGKIAAIEKRLLTEITPDLPPLIPVRAGPTPAPAPNPALGSDLKR